MNVSISLTWVIKVSLHLQAAYGFLPRFTSKIISETAELESTIKTCTYSLSGFGHLKKENMIKKGVSARGMMLITKTSTSNIPAAERKKEI